MASKSARHQQRWPQQAKGPDRTIGWWKVLDTVQKAIIGRKGGKRDDTYWWSDSKSLIYRMKKNLETKWSSELPPGTWEFRVKRVYKSSEKHLDSYELRAHYEPPEDINQLREVTGFDNRMVDYFASFWSAYDSGDNERALELYREYYQYMREE